MTRELTLAAVLVAASGCGERPALPGEAIRARVTLGEVGSSPGQFSYPRAMDAQVDESGEWLWVVDKLGRVQKLDATTGACAGWWRMPEIVLGKPTGITVGPACGPGLTETSPPSTSQSLVDTSPARAGGGGDALWLADTHYHQILVYDCGDVSDGVGGDLGTPREPRVIGRFGSYGEELGQLVYPTDVALLLDESGQIERVYVSEYGGNDRVTCFDAAFTPLFSFGEFGSSAAKEQVEFNRPQAIGIDAMRHELVVVDACNHRVGRFTLDGDLVAWIGSPETTGDQPGQFRYPWGLYLPGDGTALVVEQQGSRVQHVDLGTGESLGVYGRVGYGEGELITPWAVTMLDDRVFVLDSGNNRVIGFDGVRRRGGVAVKKSVGDSEARQAVHISCMSGRAEFVWWPPACAAGSVGEGGIGWTPPPPPASQSLAGTSPARGGGGA